MVCAIYKLLYMYSVLHLYDDLLVSLTQQTRSCVQIVGLISIFASTVGSPACLEVVRLSFHLRSELATKSGRCWTCCWESCTSALHKEGPVSKKLLRQCSRSAECASGGVRVWGWPRLWVSDLPRPLRTRTHTRIWVWITSDFNDSEVMFVYFHWRVIGILTSWEMFEVLYNTFDWEKLELYQVWLEHILFMYSKEKVKNTLKPWLIFFLGQC